MSRRAMIVCDRCGASEHADGADLTGWLQAATASIGEDPDYVAWLELCPRCADRVLAALDAEGAR